MDHLLKVITPGTRFIASIGDTSPPNTEFDRLLYIGERIEKEGKLPLQAGSFDPISQERLDRARPKPEARSHPRASETDASQDDLLGAAQRSVLAGDIDQLVDHVHRMLEIGRAHV